MSTLQAGDRAEFAVIDYDDALDRFDDDTRKKILNSMMLLVTFGVPIRQGTKGSIVETPLQYVDEPELDGVVNFLPDGMTLPANGLAYPVHSALLQPIDAPTEPATGSVEGDGRIYFEGESAA